MQASEEVKQRRSTRKYRKTNDHSLQAQNDYAHDDGPGVLDVNHDVPGDYLQGLMMDCYKPANILVSPAEALEVEAATRGQGTADKLASNLWMTERRKCVTSTVCGQIANIGVPQR